MNAGKALLPCVAAALVTCQSAAQKPLDPQAQRLLDEIARSEPKRTAEDKAAAKRQNAHGDAAYLAGRYRQAYTSYIHSYPNYPNPYAYILSGDAHWRGVAAARRRQGESCAVENKYFASDVRSDVVQHFQVGRWHRRAGTRPSWPRRSTSAPARSRRVWPNSRTAMR